MPRPSFHPTEAQQTKIETMAGLGARQEDMAAELGIAPKTLRKYFRQELRRGALAAHLGIRKSLYRQATSGRNIRATKYADQLWAGMCARRSRPEGDARLAPQIFIQTDRPRVENAEGGPAQ